jgi:release factor glutamine methyltransferase
MNTFGTLLDKAQQMEVDRLDAQMLLLHICGRNVYDRSWLYLNRDTPIDEHKTLDFFKILDRHTRGQPVAYLIGYTEFYGLTLNVNHSVLIPRNDTEILVEWALALIRTKNFCCAIDLGCGSGAIAVALKTHAPAVSVTAIDYSIEALHVAQNNATSLSLDINFKVGNWLDECKEQFDLILSNPPYIAQNDAHLAKLHAEPISALVSGIDGLSDLKIIIEQSCSHLVIGGCLLLEHGWDQGEAVRSLLSKANYSNIETRKDLAGHERVTMGIW